MNLFNKAVVIFFTAAETLLEYLAIIMQDK
jgi:hypothetical protein